MNEIQQIVEITWILSLQLSNVKRKRKTWTKIIHKNARQGLKRSDVFHIKKKKIKKLNNLSKVLHL
jgi:hypothetical protein